MSDMGSVDAAIAETVSESTLDKDARPSWRDRIKVHPAADLFPLMSESELRELGDDIKANGLRSSSLLSIAKFVSWLPEGQRNQGSFWGFCRAYEAVANGTIGEDEAIAVIGSAALRNGLSESEIRKVARSARQKVVGGGR